MRYGSDGMALWVPGTPKTERKRNVRRGAFTRTVDTKDRADWKAYLRLTASQAFSEPMHGPLRVTVYVVRPTPKGTPKKPTPRNPWPWAWCVKPDADNYGKAAHDALKGIAYLDDGQIVDARQVKCQWRDATPGLLVLVEHASEDTATVGQMLVQTLAGDGREQRLGLGAQTQEA